MYLQKMYEICSSISLVEEHLRLVGWRWNVVENLFTSNRTHFIFVFQNKNNALVFLLRLYDVGGQRSERRKWLSCFDSIQVMLFVVALSSYDIKLVEEPTVV